MDGNAYDALTDAHGGEERWAYGTGFDDPLAGVDTAVPPELDARELGLTCLVLGDDALVLSQRVAGWITNAPELEDEVALANIGLDLLGEARLLLTRAVAADPSLRPPAAPANVPDEDALAYFRDAADFRNVTLVELDDAGDFALALARLLVVVTWRLAIMQRLTTHADPVLRAVATKAVPELSYHREYAAGWVVRLGDGTDESHARMQAAVTDIVPRAAELREADPQSAAELDSVLAQVLTAATLHDPGTGAIAMRGRGGQHTDALATLLAELQDVARADEAATL
jgi:ring-1,2-phenylacetyl-CoA epoxidase subunit PaaC